MLTKSNRRILLSVLLIICIIGIQMQAAFASAPNANGSMTDRQALENLGVTGFGEIVEVKTVNVDGGDKNQYTVKSGDIINNIIVLENSDEKISLKIEQGDITNELVLLRNGDMILDGNKVEIEREIVSENMNTESEIMPLAGATIYWKDVSKLSYGTKADYSHFLKNYNVKDIKLQKAISSLSLSALLIIMGGAMSGLAGAAISFAADAGRTFYSYIQDKDPKTQVLSCKSKVYTHKNYHSGYIPSLFTYIYRYDVTCYSRAGYLGSAKGPLTVFKYNMQG